MGCASSKTQKLVKAPKIVVSQSPTCFFCCRACEFQIDAALPCSEINGQRWNTGGFHFSELLHAFLSLLRFHKRFDVYKVNWISVRASVVITFCRANFRKLNEAQPLLAMTELVCVCLHLLISDFYTDADAAFPWRMCNAVLWEQEQMMTMNTLFKSAHLAPSSLAFKPSKCTQPQCSHQAK